MLPKKMFPLIVSSWLFFASISCLADSIPITHSQKTLDMETLDTLKDPGKRMTSMFAITITNNSAKKWTDYTIFFTNPPLEGTNNNNVVLIDGLSLGNSPLFVDSSILNNKKGSGTNGERHALLRLFGGTIAPGVSFTVTLNLTYAKAVEITGQPSTETPEPASLLLFGTGMIGIAYAFRRKLRSPQDHPRVGVLTG